MSQLNNKKRSDSNLESKKNSIDSNDDFEDWNILLYGDFLKNDERVYQPLNNFKQLASILSEYQMRSNMSGNAARQIVFFKEGKKEKGKRRNLGRK